jgi:hypothetical protein
MTADEQRLYQLELKIKTLLEENLTLTKKLSTIHSLAITPGWTPARRWRIAELSSPGA